MLRLRRTGYDKPVGYIKTGIDGTETTDMIADIFTKCLDKTTFLKFRDQLMTEV